MFIPANKLENVAVIVDYNKWQATGRSNEVLALAPLREKFAAFGWNAVEVDGHSIPQLVDALKNVPDGSGKPRAVIAQILTRLEPLRTNWEIAQWFIAPNGWLDGDRPIDLLDQPEEEATLLDAADQEVAPNVG